MDGGSDSPDQPRRSVARSAIGTAAPNTGRPSSSENGTWSENLSHYFLVRIQGFSDVGPCARALDAERHRHQVLPC